MREADASANFGTISKLDIDSNPGEESYVRFSVTNVTGPVQSAKLRVFVTNASTDGPAVHETDNSWSETGITWNNRPAPTTGAVADLGAIEPNVWVEYDLTGLVTGNGVFSFVFLSNSTNGVTFSSREGADPPRLDLSYVGSAMTEFDRSSGSTIFMPIVTRGQ